jgi:Sec-independent protein secretion pathway component TatC
VSQLLLAVPMWLLYELGMLMARFVVPPASAEAPTEPESTK